MTDKEHALRKSLIKSMETTEKALERLQRAEEVIEHVRRLVDSWPGPSAAYEELEEALEEYDRNKPS